MREDIQTYKSINGEEYVIYVIYKNNATIADMGWHIRKKPYAGSSKYDIIYQGDSDKISIFKSTQSGRAITEYKKGYIKQMDDHIKQRGMSAYVQPNMDKINEAEAKAAYDAAHPNGDASEQSIEVSDIEDVKSLIPRIKISDIMADEE